METLIDDLPFMKWRGLSPVFIFSRFAVSRLHPLAYRHKIARHLSSYNRDSQ
jgi:hypothetical protein